MVSYCLESKSQEMSLPPAKKTKLSAAERRLQLIAVGRAVFAKNGYDATSMDEIAQDAGVSKPLIYEHFGGKEGLYAVIVDRETEALITHVVSSVSKGSPRARWEAAVMSLLSYAKDNPDGFAVLTRDQPNGRRGRGITTVIGETGDHLRVIFDEALERAGFNPQFSLLYAHALIGMVVQATHWWVDNPEISIEEVGRHVAAISWMGLRHLPKNPRLLTHP